MKRLAAGLLLLCAAAFAQDYVLTREIALTAAAEAVTIQQPASGARTVRFSGVYVYCSAQCDVTLEHTGTAATATSATPTPYPGVAKAATAGGFVASNVGTGTVLGRYTVAATGGMVLDLSRVALFGPGTAKNVTIRIAAVTATVKVVFEWEEY